MRILIRALAFTGAMALCGVLPALAQETGTTETTPAPPIEMTPAPTAETVPAPPVEMPSTPPSEEAVTPQESSPTPSATDSPMSLTESPMAPPDSEQLASVPTDAEFNQGLSIYQKQDFAAAVSSLEAAVRANPQSADAYFYLGYALYKLKRFDESRLAFAQAYQLQPDYRPPLVTSK